MAAAAGEEDAECFFFGGGRYISLFFVPKTWPMPPAGSIQCTTVGEGPKWLQYQNGYFSYRAVTWIVLAGDPAIDPTPYFLCYTLFRSLANLLWAVNALKYINLQLSGVVVFRAYSFLDPAAAAAASKAEEADPNFSETEPTPRKGEEIFRARRTSSYIPN